MYEKDTGEQVVLESVYIAMDPVLEGFEGVLVELSCQGESYVLTETAVGTGNRLLAFSSNNESLIYALLHQQLSNALGAGVLS